MPRELTQRPSGPGSTLAQFLIDNWPENPPSNRELADRWDYNAPGIISMWRAGASKVPIEMLPELAAFMGVDLAQLLPLWVEQYDDPKSKRRINNTKVLAAFSQMVTANEMALVKKARKLAKAQGKRDPVYTSKQLQAVEHILADDLFANLVIDEFNKGNADKSKAKQDAQKVAAKGEAGA